MVVCGSALLLLLLFRFDRVREHAQQQLFRWCASVRFVRLLLVLLLLALLSRFHFHIFLFHFHLHHQFFCCGFRCCSFAAVCPIQCCRHISIRGCLVGAVPTGCIPTIAMSPIALHQIRIEPSTKTLLEATSPATVSIHFADGTLLIVRTAIQLLEAYRASEEAFASTATQTAIMPSGTFCSTNSTIIGWRRGGRRGCG